jgi:hypothetical protein
VLCDARNKKASSWNYRSQLHAVEQKIDARRAPRSLDALTSATGSLLLFPWLPHVFPESPPLLNFV